jgi:arylsulfatase A-like enzyme
MQGRVESIRDNLVLAYRDVQRALVTPQWKLIRYPKIHRTQLFDIHNDPEEVTDISSRPEQASRVQELVGSLKQELQRSSDTLALTVENPLPEEWTPPVRKRP